MTTRLRLWTVPLVGFLLAGPVDAGSFDVLRYDEATIADIQAAFKAKTLTCRMLVQMYLDRIEAYDKNGGRNPEFTVAFGALREGASDPPLSPSPLLTQHG